MSNKLYEGLLSLHSDGEADDVLFLSSCTEPLADTLLDDIGRKQVTARYWVCDKQCTKEEASENLVKQIMGDAKVKYGHAYSEVTGYLWTDEEIKIGGHDLLEELKSAVGKWLILEVEIH